MLLVGTAFGATLLLLKRHAESSRAAGYLLASLAGLWGVLAGVLGCIFGFFWLFTDHEIAHANENLLLFPPWAFGLTFACIGWIRRKRQWRARLAFWSTLLAAGSVLALLFKLLPWFRQDIWMFAALAVPIWVTLAWAVRQPVARRDARDPRNQDQLGRDGLTDWSL